MLEIERRLRKFGIENFVHGDPMTSNLSHCGDLTFFVAINERKVSMKSLVDSIGYKSLNR